MKSKKFYKIELINIPSLFGMILVVGFMLGLTYLKIKDPLGWTPYGYLAGMAFLSLGLIVVLGISYFVYGKYKKEFLRQRQEILENGVRVPGKVIDTKEIVNVVRSRSNTGETRTKTYKDYKVLVEFEYRGENVQYWTPELAFNGEKLTSDGVSVYVYKDQYYVDDFEIEAKYLKKWSVFFGRGAHHFWNC